MRQLRKSFYYAQFIFAVLTLISGTLLHFLYDWTDANFFVGIFSPVNESVWEHLKMLFFPILFYSVFEYVYIGRYFSSFIPARIIGLFFSMAFTVVFFYTYTGIIGTHHLWVDVLTFLAATVLCYFLTWHLVITKRAELQRTTIVYLAVLLLMLYLFCHFTKHPPGLNLFQSGV